MPKESEQQQPGSSQPTFGSELSSDFAELNGAERVEPISTLPDFSHLLAHPFTEGKYTGMEHILETMVQRHLEDPAEAVPQVLIFMGIHASGKSSNVLHAIHYIELRSTQMGNPIKPTYVAYDSAIDFKNELKEKYGDSIDTESLSKHDHTLESGKRTPEFYESATDTFRAGLRKAIQRGGFVIAETPAVGGIRFDRNVVERTPGALIGLDRGTTAIRDLSRRKGFEDLYYDIFVAALVSEPHQYFENLESRRRESIRDVAKRPGAPYKGTLNAIEEARELLHQYYSEIDGRKIPQAAITVPGILVALAKDYHPWELRRYFRLKREQMAVLENRGADYLHKVRKADIEPYNFFHQISEDEELEFVLTDPLVEF